MKLKNWLFVLGFLLGSVALENSGFALNVDKVIAFGDSLSDNGNVFSLTKEARKMVPTSPIIPDDPYYSGRFSNGPVWVENIAKALNVPLNDYAYGGAWAEGFSDSHLLVPFDLRMQVDFYLVRASYDYQKAKHLYTLWIGANDYIRWRKDKEYATTNTVTKIRNAIESLINYGVRNILLLNLPDLGTLPIIKVKALTYGQEMSEISRLHNQKLAAMINEEKSKHPQVHFMLLDVNAYYSEVRKAIEGGAVYGSVKNMNDACYNGGYYLGINFAADAIVRAAKESNLDINNAPELKVALLTSRFAALQDKTTCSTPDDYFYWDLVHPSRVVHAKLSEIALKMLAEQVE